MSGLIYFMKKKISSLLMLNMEEIDYTLPPQVEDDGYLDIEKGIDIAKHLEEVQNASKLAQLRDMFYNLILSAKSFDFTNMEEVRQKTFWEGKGIHIEGETSQCVLHLKTNLIFTQDGKIVGKIDENFEVTHVDDLDKDVLDWIYLNKLKIN